MLPLAYVRVEAYLEVKKQTHKIGVIVVLLETTAMEWRGLSYSAGPLTQLLRN